MSSAKLHFPSAEVITKFFSNYEELNDEYYREKGITQAITALAAKRFADSSRREESIEMNAMLIIHDLMKGKDGFSGEKLIQIELQAESLHQLTVSIKKALIACAKIQEGERKTES